MCWSVICLLYSNRATLQGPGGSSFNTHLHQVTWLNVPLPFRLWEEHQLVGAIAPFPLLPSMRAVLLLNQYLFHLAKILLIDLEGNTFLHLFHCMESAFLFWQRDIVLPACSYGARTWRVSRHMHNIEANLLNQVDGTLEFFFSLAAEAHNHIGGERDSGPQRTHPFNAFAVLGKRIPTFHALQCGIVTSLHGNVQVLADLRQCCHALNHAVGHVARIRGHEANTFQPADFTKTTHQVSKVGL